MAALSTLKKPATKKAVQAAVKAQAKTQPSPTRASSAQEGWPAQGQAATTEPKEGWPAEGQEGTEAGAESPLVKKEIVSPQKPPRS